MMLAEDARNGLTLAGYPGYEDLPIMETSPRMAAIRDLSPAAADEIEREFKKKHVLSIDAVAAAWPQVKDRLLKDRDMAHLGDLRAQAKFYGATVH